MKLSRLILPGLLMAATLHAAEEVDPSIKLREQLRGVTLQLRTAQTESANAQAVAAAAEQKSKDLAAKIGELEKRNAALAKQANTDKASAAESIDTLEKKVADRDKNLALHKEALAKWKDGYDNAVAVANTKEAERAKLASELTSTKHTLADRERKNIALFNVSNEILDKFENYSLGKALSAREPFIGTTRVKVENLVQDYKDQILDNRIAAPSKKSDKP
ncbi:MAG: phage major capsid protein [Verrucomicrobiaceae bacterium]|nr:MAG: phage major capsid protein [Verrucomicrobiaceae bacterium]